MELQHFQRLVSCYLTLLEITKEERLWFLEYIIEKYCLVCGSVKGECDCNGDLINKTKDGV